jgi:signal transduction histidine kinase
MNTDWDRISDDEKRQFVSIIERQARRMSDLVDELVRLVRERTGVQPVSNVGASAPDS